MRYQERIYVQNDFQGVRNKDILNVNMSSDFCIFKSPKFDVSGATKVQCSSITCDLSGYSFGNMLSAATATCFSGSMSATCFSSTTWETTISENDAVTYSATIFTSLVLSGGVPTNSSFINSVITGFNVLGVTYTQSGTTFTIDKPYGVKDWSIDVCISFGIAQGILACPAGFSATPANDACQKILTTAATYNGSGATIIIGNADPAYTNYGTYFYPNILGNNALPLYYQGNAQPLLDQTGGTITPLAINNIAPFWGNPGVINTAGRLNNVGLSAASDQYLGFSKCIDIASGHTYYIGIAADNRCKFTINGILIANFSGSVSDSFKKWSVFAIPLKSGKNIIELYGENDPATSSAFGAEIYDPISFATLTAATSTGASQANVIFSTANFVGMTWDIGTTVGYTCPAGYSVDGCGTAFTCTEIIKTGFTQNCSGSCSEDCTVICSNTFPYINNASPGVYIIDTTTATTLPLVFNFTANTDVFTANNATFKFEIYKYNPNLGIFTVPPVYKSDTVGFSAFSATNILFQSVPFSGLSLDGDYLIKGYYEADACTDFLKRLGKKIDTVLYKQGEAYQLYDPALDFYFVGISKADKPLFTTSQNNDIAFYDALPLYQQVILVDDDADFNVTEDNGDQDIIATGNSYTRSGSTFTLNSEYIGDVVVTLNGLGLAKDIDYTLSGTILTFFGAIVNGDVITIIYTRSTVLTIVANSIQITTAIPSGTTGTQGSSSYFYNSTTGKYEIYLENTPLDNSRMIVILNGVFLASGIDFYQSTSDKNRIILAGTLLMGDILTVVYYPAANVINGIYQTNNVIDWYIQHEPLSNNGEFSVQYSTDINFSSYTVSSVVPYQPLVTSYSSTLTLTGAVGTELFYRVKNTKDYKSICGDIIESIAYSETVPVVIQTNAINSY